jgi:hypothetical protein
MAPMQPTAEPLVVSRSADIKRATKLVQLPVAQDGVTIVVKVRAAKVAALLAELEGVPSLNAAPSPSRTRTFAEAREAILAQLAPSRRIAELGLIEPAFSFGDAPEDGKAWWDDLIADNQACVIEEIMSLSGLRGDAAKQAGTFPAGAVGDGAAGAVGAPTS